MNRPHITPMIPDSRWRGVFWAVTVGESAIAVLAAAVFLRSRWKLRVF